MNPRLKALLARARYMKPADDDTGADAGGAGAVVDRGDDFVPPDAPDAQAVADAAAEAERIRLEEEAKAAAAAGGDTQTDEEKAAAAAAAAADADKGKKAMIPVERHKQMLDKLREERDAALAQAQAVTNAQKAATTNEEIAALEATIIEKEEAYNKALIDGDTKAATALMREIRTAERTVTESRAEMKAQIATAQAVETVRYNTVVERLEASYSVLNPDHEDFDQEKIQDVMDLAATYQRRGQPMSDALQKAVKTLLGAATTGQKTAVDTTPRVSADDAAAAAAAKEAATKKALDAEKRQPPNAAKVGTDSDKKGGGLISAEDVMKMSQDKFSKLDEVTLARLRGDSV